MKSLKLTAIALGVLLTLTPAQANINAEMQDMFNAMGAVGNVTEPGAFRGQSRNLYTGGSLSMRVPQRNFQLFSLQAPSFKHGCGGIDLFGGAFSFVNSEQLVAMLQNIGSVAVTQAFLLALDSISPEIGKTLKTMQEWAQKFNGMAINSCEAGQALAHGVFGEMNEAKSHACRSVKSGSGATPDYAKSWFECNSQGPGGTVSTAQGANNKLKFSTFVDGNVMWRALQGINGIDDSTRELLMSFTGTYIIKRNGDGTDEEMSIDPRAPTLTKLGQFVDGMGTEDENGEIVLTVYSCGADPLDCMSPVTKATTVKSFRRRAEDAMRDMVDGMIGREAINAASVGFVNSSRLPVKRMLDVTTQVDRNTAYSAINSWRDSVAMDLAREFLLRALEDARRMMQTRNASKVEQGFIDRINQSINSTITQVNSETQNILTKEAAMQQTAAYLEQMNRAMWSGAPAALRASLLFR